MTQTTGTAKDESRTYRDIPHGRGLCAVCGTVQMLTVHHRVLPSEVNKYGFRVTPMLLFVHGPRAARCAGSHARPVPWLEASGLPAWEELSDLDKGAALLHVWKRHWERSGPYAIANYPACYFDDGLLVGLDSRTASRHASVVCGSWDEVCRRLGDAEVTRLYDLALAADRARDGRDAA